MRNLQTEPKHIDKQDLGSFGWEKKISRILCVGFILNVVMSKMEITPPVADIRYFSFLDKSKQDIESSGLVLGRSLFISSNLLGFHKLG